MATKYLFLNISSFLWISKKFYFFILSIFEVLGVRQDRFTQLSANCYSVYWENQTIFIMTTETLINEIKKKNMQLDHIFYFSTWLMKRHLKFENWKKIWTNLSEVAIKKKKNVNHNRTWARSSINRLVTVTSWISSNK